MKKFFKITLLALAALANTTLTYAEEVTEGFESVTLVNADSWGRATELSNGWIIQGGYIATSADSQNYGFWTTKYAGSKSLTAQYGSSNAAIVVIPQQLTGSFTFYARKTSTSSSTKGYIYIYEMEEDGESFKKGATLLNSPTLTTTWTKYTVDLGEEPHYVGINMIRAGVDEIVYNTYEAAAGPRLQVLQDGKAVKSGVSYNFGLVAENATATYTVKNTGTETMTATLACTGDYTVSPASVSLGADETVDITITQSAATTGNKAGALTITPEGLDAFTINLSGIVRDPAKLYVDFSETPADWTMSGWSINADGYATIGSNYYYSNTSISNNKALQTSLLKAEEGEQLFIRYRKNYNSSYSNGTLCFWASADGSTWTKVGDNVTATEYNVWAETTISGFPTSTKYVAISGQYMDIDDFYGFELSADPVMTIAGETVTDNTIEQNFGKCKTDATKTYTIKNIGGGALHVDLTNSNTTDFTISETSLDVAAGESATFDLTFNFSTEYGTKNATVTLTPNAGDVVTINVAAAAQDPEEFTEDFEGGIPASWTNKGWTIKDNPTYGNGTKMVYAGYYNTNTLVSPRLQATAGDIIDIEALQNYNDEPLILEYSLDDGETWTQGFSEVPAANNTLHTLHFTAPETGVYLLRFSGRYNYIDNICGFKLAQIPVMEVSTTCGASKEGDVFTDNFGRLTADASHTYTVSNTGAGTLVVNIASNNADFTVSESTLEVGAGESKTFDVTFVHSDNYGAKAAAITIDPTYDGLATITINATANCADPDAFIEDFEGGIPAGWINNGWKIETRNGSKMAYSYTYETPLTTPVLIAKEGDVLTFDAFQQWDDEPLKLEYSTDGENWTVAFDEAPAANNTARQFEFTAPADGCYVLRFSGSYNYIDNVCGFKLAADKMYAATSNLKIWSSNKWATICYPMEVTLPAGVTAYKATVINDNGEEGKTIHMEPLEGNTVQAWEPVALYSESDATIDLTGAIYDKPAEAVIQGTDDNILCGSVGDYTVEESKTVFCLANKTNGVGFYPVKTGNTLPAFRAFIKMESPSEAKALIIILGDDDADAIRSAAANNAESEIYNLSGQRMLKAVRGINIVGGKKVLY